MLLATAFLLFKSYTVVAMQLQGILLSNTEVDTPMLKEGFQSHRALQLVVKSCAQLAVQEERTIFAVTRAYDWIPHPTPQELEYQADAPYSCRLQSEPGSVNYRMHKASKSFACQGRNCTDRLHFKSIPDGIELHGYQSSKDLQQGFPAISFEECRALIAGNNNQSAPQIMFTHGSWKLYLDKDQLKSSCRGFDRVSEPPYQVLETHVGILSPPKLVHALPLSSRFNSGPFGSLADVSCTQKDIEAEQGNDCEPFVYEIPAHTTVSNNPNRLSLENTTLPASYRSVHYTRRERFALTYRKIAQTDNRILAMNANPAQWQANKAIEAYSADEAFRECADSALRSMHHTINVFLTHRGWRCMHTFNFLTDPTLLSTRDNTVVHSYMYSANYTSQNDLEA